MRPMTSKAARFPPALSFSEGNELRRLFECAVDPSRGSKYLTLVCGAGISMDAGLPNWTTLVERILSEVEEDYREWLLEDPIDISRKVSVTEALLPKHKHNHEVLRRALYAHVAEAARPGILSRAIARFASTPLAGGPRQHPATRIATLNFDDLLELALDEAGRGTGAPPWIPRPISGVDTWLRERQPGSVVHLHGLVPSDGSRIVEPVVLGEADFVIHGAAVREALVKILTSGHTVFVGLSMTDPNIVGALLDERVQSAQDCCRFVVVSPETAPSERAAPGATPKRRTYEQYARLRGQATAKYLGVTPIFLNSIAQNSQLFLELTLARTRPDEYMADDSPIRYGRRLLPVVRRIHATAGLTDTGGSPSWVAEQQQFVSDALTKRLDEVVELLRQMARSLDYSEALGHRLQLQLQGTENFGLFLWVRALPDELGNPEYSLQLAGTSAYVHRGPATGRLLVPIAPSSGYPAADAVYFGNARLASLGNTTAPRPVWKSLFAVPVSVNAEGVDLNCGAISVNSTLPSDSTAADRSVLAHLKPSQQDKLADTLMQIAVDVLPGP